ncbi:protein crossbronx-like [Drosophila teissieri]|uniref:protein crossbronx-like n=1 Tax=Drosophila teissieri TaxID=7243 RepID=UPI001CB9F7E3|nr:protein crossbronx-like [Drosophila teissieri]
MLTLSLPTIIFQQDVIYPHVCPCEVPGSHFLRSLRGIEVEVDKLKNSEAAELLVTNQEEEYVAGKEHIFDTPPTEDPHYIVFVQLQLFKR